MFFVDFQTKNDSLWHITLQSKQNNMINMSAPSLVINYAITKDRTKIELAEYSHATAFSPSFSTFQKATYNSNFITWSGIMELNLKNV